MESCTARTPVRYYSYARGGGGCVPRLEYKARAASLRRRANIYFLAGALCVSRAFHFILYGTSSWFTGYPHEERRCRILRLLLLLFLASSTPSWRSSPSRVLRSPRVCNFLVANGRNREARRLGQVTARCLIETRRVKMSSAKRTFAKNLSSAWKLRVRSSRPRVNFLIRLEDSCPRSFFVESYVGSNRFFSFFFFLFFVLLLFGKLLINRSLFGVILSRRGSRR